MGHLTVCNFIIIAILSIELFTTTCYGQNVTLSVNKEIDAVVTVEGVNELVNEGDGDKTSSQDQVDSSVSEDEESVSIEEAILESSEEEVDKDNEADVVDSPVLEDEAPAPIEEAGSTVMEASSPTSEAFQEELSEGEVKDETNEPGAVDTQESEDDLSVPVGGSSTLASEPLQDGPEGEVVEETLEPLQEELSEEVKDETNEPGAVDTQESEDELSAPVGGFSTLASEPLQDGPEGEVVEETLEQGQLDPLESNAEASGPMEVKSDIKVTASDPFNEFEESQNGIQDAAKPPTDASQPVVSAANGGFIANGFEKVSNEILEGANVIVSPLVGLGTKFAKPFVNVGSKVATPFKELGSKFQVSVARAKALVKKVGLDLKTKLKQNILEPKLVFFAPLAKAASKVVSAPGEFISSGLIGNQVVPEVDVDPMETSNVVLSGNVPRPVDVEEVMEEEEVVGMEEVIEGETFDPDQLQPIVDSLRPLTVATQDLSDAFLPIVDAVNVEEPVTFQEISEDVADILGPVAQAAAPVVGLKSELAAPVVKLGAEAVAPVVKIGAKIAKKNADIVSVPIARLTDTVATAGRSAKEFFAESSLDKGFSGGFRIKKVPDGPLDFGLFGGGGVEIGGLDEVGVEEVGGDVDDSDEEEPIQENGNLVAQSIGGEETFPVVVDDSLEDIVADPDSDSDPRAQQSHLDRRSVNEGNQLGPEGVAPNFKIAARKVDKALNPTAKLLATLFFPFEVLDIAVGVNDSGEEERVQIAFPSFFDIIAHSIGGGASVTGSRDQQSNRDRRSVNEGNQHRGSSGKVPELLLDRRRSPYAQSFTNYGDKSGEIVTYFEDTPYMAHPLSRRKPYRSRLERPSVEKVGAKVEGVDQEGEEERNDVLQEKLESSEGRMPTATNLTATESLEEVDEAIVDEDSSQEVEPKFFNIFQFDDEDAAPVEPAGPVETAPPKCKPELTYMTTSICHRVEEYSISKCDRTCGSLDEDVEELIELCKAPSNEQMCKFMVKTSKMEGDAEPCEVYSFKFFRLLDFSSYCRSQIKCAVESHLCQRWD